MRKLLSLRYTAVFCLILAAIAPAALAQVTVSISSPASGTVGTSVTVNASASSPNGMSGWYIYVDGNAAWNTPGPANSISAPLKLAVGTHYVIVRAWDNLGAYNDAALNLNVVQSAITVTTSAPSSGSMVTNPVTFKASGSSPNGISGWVIYCDSQGVYQVDNNSNSLTASVNLAIGSHSCFVRAWDKVSGYGSSAPVSINVGQAQGTAVTVNSPANGAAVTSPVTFSASGSSPNGISGWVIYANDQNVYQVDNNSNSLSANVNLSAGTYTVYVRAWDKVSGYGTSSPMKITVGSVTTSGSSGGTTVSALPTPPSNAVILGHIEDNTNNWNSCSDCAGPLNVTSDYWMAPFQTSPSLDGSSKEFYVSGMPWTAALFYHPVQSYSGQYNYATHFLWDFWAYVNSASMQNVWDLEFDLYQAINGYEYMIGTHCLFSSSQQGNYWYGWDQAAGHWVQTSAPCSKSLFAPDKWHHIQWMLERVPNSRNYKYDTLVVDGTAYPINMTQPASWTGWSDVLGVQFQIDTNSNGGSAHMWVDKVNLTLW